MAVATRIVVKLRNGSPGEGQKDGRERLIEALGAAWIRLLGDFPTMIVERLIQSVTENQLNQLIKLARKRQPKYYPPNFFNYLAVLCPRDDAEKILKRLSEFDGVEYAYIRPDDEPASPLAKLPPAPAVTADLWSAANSTHLMNSPEGLGATGIWQYEGADGVGQHLIDIELGWTLNHVDLLRAPTAGPWISSATPTGQKYKDAPEWVGHGTSVLAIACATYNQERLVGFVPRLASATVVGTASTSQVKLETLADSLAYAGVLRAGLDQHLEALPGATVGGVVLIPLQVPKANGAELKYPVEIYPETRSLIKLLTSAGITVIESAGNGSVRSGSGVNLDVAISVGAGNKRLAVSLNRNRPSAAYEDSGAIMVGGADFDRTMPLPRRWRRLPELNFGSRIDCYAAGKGVFTASSAIAASGSSDTTMTIGNFDGTSAAAAIIAGGALSLLGVYEANKNARMSPEDLRAAFRDATLGTPVYDANSPATAAPIGVMPDLVKIVAHKIP